MNIRFPYEETYNYYGDETSHIANDGNRYMALGALCCRKFDAKRLSNEINAIKSRHNIAKNFEIKSTKISVGAIEFYKELVEWFLTSPDVILRIVLIDKSIVKYNNFNVYDTFYYKMYYTLFRYYLYGEENHIYLDYKDRRGNLRCAEIKEIMSRDHITSMKSITVQQMNSKESNLIQMTDLLIGLICYNANEKKLSKAKLELIDVLKQSTGLDLFSTTFNSDYNNKIDILNWRPKK